MTQPTSGTTTFNDISGFHTLASGNGTSVTATNVDGWDFTAEFTTSVGASGAIQAFPQNYSFFNSGEFIRVRGTGSADFALALVKPDDGSTFTLNSVDIVIPGIDVNGGHTGAITLQGYLNGVAVTGATVTETVNDSSANTFNVSSNSAFAGIDSFGVFGDDGSGELNIGVDFDNINASNFGFPPVLTVSNGNAAFVAADNTTSTPIVVDNGLTVVDTNSSTLASATVAITSNFQSSEDVLAFTNNNSSNYGNIAASYNSSTGVLTLTSSGSTATVAQFQAALRAVTYTDTAITPNNAARTISFVASDGTSNSTAVTRGVTVADTDQTPIVTASSGSASFVSGNNAPSTPVAIDTGLTVSDLDNPTLPSATVSFSSGFQSSEDVLAFTNTSSSLYGNISASYNSGTGQLSLTSSSAMATLAQWQAALRAVTYTDTAITPNTATRTIQFTVNDGTENSTLVSRNIGITDTDQSPIVTTSGSTAQFVEGDNVVTSVVIDGALTVTDLDNPTQASGTVAITGNLQAGEDVLAFTNDNATLYGNISASYNASTGVLSLVSSGATATLAQWQAALSRVTYSDTAGVPNATPRTISFTVNDGTTNSNVATDLVGVTATPQTPIITQPSGSSTDPLPGTPVPVDPDITVTDRDGSHFTQATIAITEEFDGTQDLLAFTNTGGEGDITGSYDPATGILTLTSSGGSATESEWTTALQAVTYTDTSAAADTLPRTISISVTNGVDTSIAATRTVDIGADSQVPISARTTALYRFFDAANGTHFITASVSEKNAITDPSSPDYQPDFVAETNTFAAIAPSLDDPDAIPVYRFFDTTSGADFMTASASERDAIMNPSSGDYRANYIYEPQATFYEHATQHFGDVAVYRYFDTTDGTHFYVSDPTEITGITTPGSTAYRPDLTIEGIAFYAPSGSFT